jgi:SCY1-like protein 1
MVREQTVKAVLTIIGKLSDRTVNGELLKYLAKTSNDEQPGIRTNTTICLGKIAKNLGVGNRAKVLIAAFTRSLRDPFVHARNAALMALGATLDSYSEDDCANKILPALCPCLIDKEKLIRDQANKTMDLFLQRIRKFGSTMADTILPPPSANDNPSASAPRMGTPQPSEAASWTGWAISSFTNKVSTATGEIQASSNGAAAAAPRSNSSPALETRRAPPKLTASASHLHRQAVASPPVTSARTSTSSTTNDYFQDPNDNANDGFDDSWGNMGDMDEDTSVDTPSETPKATTKPTSAPANPVNDSDEPDFSGWLAAQAGKKPGAKALPKGLAKPAASRPLASSRTASTGGIGGAGAKRAAAVKAKPLGAKKIEPVTKKADDDDGWGDGW